MSVIMPVWLELQEFIVRKYKKTSIDVFVSFVFFLGVKQKSIFCRKITT